MSAYTHEVASLILTISSLKKHSKAPAFSLDISLIFVCTRVRGTYDALKFIFSEKATKFCKISTLILSYVVPVKSKVKILQNYVAFSEYMNIK